MQPLDITHAKRTPLGVAPSIMPPQPQALEHRLDPGAELRAVWDGEPRRPAERSHGGQWHDCVTALHG